MIHLAIDALRDLEGVKIHSGLDIRLLGQLEATEGFSLPLDHTEILRWSNGVGAYSGYLRLFGVGESADVDSIVWNQQDCWKFAWGDRCSAHWCFAETAWGDQYAYSIDALRKEGESAVYFFDAISMTPRVVGDSFTEFFEKEFIRSAREPYDEMIRLARRKFGSLSVTQHLVYMPSLLVGGKESIENIQMMDSRASMICNGDLALQLDGGPSGGSVKGVNSYQDQQGRTRLRLEWCTGPANL